MAHAVVEWTDNLAAEGFAVRPLLSLIAARMRDSGIFPVGGIRVRGQRLTDYVIADGSGEDAFIDIRVLMGAGREADVRRTFFDGLFEAVGVELAPVFARRPLALSLYVDEAEGWKRNTIHQRLEARRDAAR